jgi:SAM-dependent methyltransferase
VNGASFTRSARFPAAAFHSIEEFRAYQVEMRTPLETRAAYHRSLATLDSTQSCAGTCAPCLRPSRFTSSTAGAETLKDGRKLPDWNQQMRCDCKEALTARERALLHFMQATAITPWTHSLLFGPSGTERRLAESVDTLVRIPGLRPGDAPSLDAPSARFHLAVSQDYLNRVPALPAALAEILRVLVPGGRFVFTIPFQFTAAASVFMNSDDPISVRSEHKLGWDLLPLLRQAGFRQAAAYLYWSEELGYLGDTNFIFKAVK